jgi:hypothetical protein
VRTTRHIDNNIAVLELSKELLTVPAKHFIVYSVVPSTFRKVVSRYRKRTTILELLWSHTFIGIEWRLQQPVRHPHWCHGPSFGKGSTTYEGVIVSLPNDVSNKKLFNVRMQMTDRSYFSLLDQTNGCMRIFWPCVCFETILVIVLSSLFYIKVTNYHIFCFDCTTCNG